LLTIPQNQDHFKNLLAGIAGLCPPQGGAASATANAVLYFLQDGAIFSHSPFTAATGEPAVFSLAKEGIYDYG